MVPTQYEHNANDMFTLAMQVDRDRSLTSLYDMELIEKERIRTIGMGLLQPTGVQSDFGDSFDINQINQSLLPPEPARGIELSRVSGDLVFTEDEESDEQDDEAKKAAE